MLLYITLLDKALQHFGQYHLFLASFDASWMPRFNSSLNFPANEDSLSAPCFSPPSTAPSPAILLPL